MNSENRASRDTHSFRNHTGSTLRAIASGTVIGILINLSNTYYGLRTGSGDQMAMISALLGFVAVKVLPGLRSKDIEVAENVLIVSIATATGCMPITAGFVGIIPALEYLIGPEENGPIPLSFRTLLLWSGSLCFFGLIFASLLRNHFVVNEKLPWPGPKAAAQLLDTLHQVPSKSSELATDAGSRQWQRHDLPPVIDHPQSSLDLSGNMNWKSAIAHLVWGGLLSGVLSAVMYFVPILHSLPLFGEAAADDWLWKIDLSPGFFGQGMITGPIIPLHMLMGATVGWGILSPYAKSKGWAPGEVDDWTTGSRGWIIWISLASLMADASVKLTWFVVRPLYHRYKTKSGLRRRVMHSARRLADSSERQPFLNTFNTVSTDSQADTAIRHDSQYPDAIRSSNIHDKEHLSFQAGITPRILAVSFLFTIVICVFGIHLIFRQYMRWFYTVLGIILSLPMAVIGIRALAETDWNPESALVSQLTFASVIPHTNPSGIIINLISAAIAQAGANQSGDIAYDFKIGHLLGAQPSAQVFGHILGSFVGAIVSCCIYKLYASQYPIPGPLFQIPSSYLVLSTARLVMGRGLPPGVAPFAVGALVLSAAGTIVKMRYASYRWQLLIPSGISFAIGIYLVPSFSIVRVLGGLFTWVYERNVPNSHSKMIIIASGIVLGESVASLVSLAFTALGVPHLVR